VTLIALDLDGTLEDSRVDMVGAIVRVRERLGLPARPGAEFRDHVIRGMPHLYAHCFAEHLEGDDGRRLAGIRDAYTAEYSAHIDDTTRLYDGMAEALAALADIGRLALVTNKPEGLSDQLLRALGVRRLFGAVIGGDTCPTAKPTPAPLAEAVARLGGGGPVFMVGDSAGDIACGSAFGATTIWCQWGYKDDPGPRAPDAIAENPGALPSIIQARLAR
jgi:phosphoglycolate phosphatase